MKKENTTEAKKLTEKAFTRLMLTSLIGVLLCLAGLSSATWALFSANVSNNSNTFGSGVYALNIEIFDSENNLKVAKTTADGSASYIFNNEGKYKVVLKTTDKTTVTNGFCIIKTEDSKYKTAQVGADGASVLEFEIDVKTPGAAVTFYSSWGIPSSIEISEGSILALQAK